MFSLDPVKANLHTVNKLYLVKEYGSYCNRKRLYCCDSGERWLSRCKICGNYVLVQWSEDFNGDAYIDYIPVDSEKHAEELNEIYDGDDIENIYQSKMLFISPGKVFWHNNEF